MKTLGWQIESISLVCLECAQNIETGDGSGLFSPEDLDVKAKFKCPFCGEEFELPDSLTAIIGDMSRVQV